MAVMKKGKLMRLMIINAGTKLYLENGFSNTANIQICKKLDISTGQFTFYFPTKEHLLKELVKELCKFQYKFMERLVSKGNSSLLAICMEMATIAAVCEADPHIKDFYIAAYTHPMTLEVIRESDIRRAKRVYREFCPDWTDANYARIQTLVTGIEYSTLMTRDKNISMDQRIATALDGIMKLYNVPEELRRDKIEKVLSADYGAIGKQVLQEFKQYVEQVNKRALEQELLLSDHVPCGAREKTVKSHISKERAI